MHWPDSFQANRRIRTVNLVLQAVLFVTLFAGINYLALVHSWRFDLTRNRIFSLSAETVAYVEKIDQPVNVMVAFDTSDDDPDIAQARRDVLALLREYARLRHLGRPVLNFDEIDVLQSGRRAAQLNITEPNVVVFSSGNRPPRTVRWKELYRVARQEKVAFVGEEQFTAAILDVTSAGKQRVYFLTGHGEMDPGSADPLRGLSDFQRELRSRNLDVETLDLRLQRRIPADAALLVAIAPMQAFLPQEQELLREYLSNRTGRLLLALDPPADRRTATGLEALFADWGLELPDAVAEDPDPQASPPGGQIILRGYSRHPVVSALLHTGSGVVVGRSRPVLFPPGNAALNVTPLIRTSESGWGERTYRATSDPVFDPATDIAGPVWIAAVSEGASAAGNLPFSVRSGRLLVFGSSDFFSNPGFGNLGNSMLAVNAVNWALDQMSQINVPPRPLEKFQLTLSETDLRKLRLALLLAVPGAVALLGFIVHWSRRS